MTRPNIFGTFWQRLARRNCSPESMMAAQAVDTTKLEQLVYDTIATFEHGCIQDEVLYALPHLPYSSVTARFRALLDKGYIEDTGHRRAGRSGRMQRVIKIKEPDHA